MSIICPLFSGSTGNSTYIANENTGILVDAGASCKAIGESLFRVGSELSNIKAIFITHEHIDHIKGLKTVLKKTNAELYASKETLEVLASNDIIPVGTKAFEISDKAVLVNGVLVNRFATSHDCIGSSGYTFTLSDDKKISVCTDLGVITETVSNALNGSDIVLLESNHDVERLKKGPYPPQLKVRIMSDKGHISNSVCASELKKLLQNGCQRFILGHLSQENNTPNLARSTVESALIDIGAREGVDYLLKVASPKGNGVMTL